MKKDELIKHLLFNEDCVESYPFKQEQYEKLPVIRHKNGEKWFALVFRLEGVLFVNLKCLPHESAILRDEYDFITPAWHMNKSHWIKVDVKKCPVDLLDCLIKKSFDLTAKKRTKCNIKL